MKTAKVVTCGPEETLTQGVEVSKTLKAGDFVALTGDLGAGKTVLTKGIAMGLGVKNAKYVNSPTFVILKTYEGKLPLYHFDIYRLASSGDLDTVGYEEYFYGKGVTVVEWADKIKDILPDKRLDINMEHAGESKRRITIKDLR